MARFRCRACGSEGTFVYEGHRGCPDCGSMDVQLALSIKKIPDDDPIIETLRRLSRNTERKTNVLLWILSDLHLETTHNWDLPFGSARPHFDVMIVAGDLVPRAERGVRWLRERVPDHPVIYVPGNHEGYGCDIDRTVEKAKEAAAGSKIFVLQNDAIQLGNVTFAGATAWTDFALFGDRQRAMAVAAERNDFKKIRISKYAERFRPKHALARHIESRAFFEAEMRKPRSGALVVVSHHAPHPGHISSRLPDTDWRSDDDVLTAAYRSDLTSLMWPSPITDEPNALRPADLWIYGHTHESEDITIGRTRVVSNAKGYGPWKLGETWDNPLFDPHYIIEV